MNSDQLFWREQLKALQERREYALQILAEVEKAELDAHEAFRHASLWQLNLGNLNMPRLRIEITTWAEVLKHIKDPVYGITAHNWSGTDDWLVHFYQGTKRAPHKLHVGSAIRIGWNTSK